MQPGAIVPTIAFTSQPPTTPQPPPSLLHSFMQPGAIVPKIALTSQPPPTPPTPPLLHSLMQPGAIRPKIALTSQPPPTPPPPPPPPFVYAARGDCTKNCTTTTTTSHIHGAPATQFNKPPQRAPATSMEHQPHTSITTDTATHHYRPPDT
jgi:hypothetical protein